MKSAIKHNIESLIHSIKKRRINAYIILVGLAVQFAIVTKVCSLPPHHFVDSTRTERNDDTIKRPLSLTVNVNSLGYFGYGGRIVSDKQSLDASLIYERPKFGALFYKVVDLYDHSSPNNFAMVMVFTKFILSGRVTIKPYVGMVVEQINGFADKDSDFGSIITSTLKLNRHVSLDHTAVFSNLALAPHHKDWVNRLRLIYNSGPYNLTWLGWHNNRLLDTSSYYSTGLSFAYKKLALSDDLTMNTGLTIIKMIHSSNMEENTIKNGLLLNIALVID